MDFIAPFILVTRFYDLIYDCDSTNPIGEYLNHFLFLKLELKSSMSCCYHQTYDMGQTFFLACFMNKLLFLIYRHSNVHLENIQHC